MELEITSDKARHINEFARLYEIMQNAKQFDSNVDISEFGRIQDTLSPEEKMMMFMARKDGQAVGALACSLMGDTAIYLLGATNDRARELKAHTPALAGDHIG